MKTTKTQLRKNTSRPKRQSGTIQFSKASPTMLFRTLVLCSTLIVAAVAIQKGISDSNVWSFLGSVVIYTALTTKTDAKTQDD